MLAGTLIGLILDLCLQQVTEGAGSLADIVFRLRRSGCFHLRCGLRVQAQADPAAFAIYLQAVAVTFWPVLTISSG